MAGSIDELLKDAMASLNAGRPDDAERHFKALLRLQPNNIAALNILGAVLASQHKYAEAEPHLRSALRINATSDSTFYNYGVVLKGLGRLAEALQQFDKALAINPNVADTWNNRGTVLNELGRYQDALADFDRSLALQPNAPATYCNRARSLEGLERHTEALAAYDKALAMAPGFAEGWLGRGTVLTGLVRDQEAIDAIARALTLKPQLAEAWIARGFLMTKHRRHEEAAASYQQVLTLRPDHVEAWIGRGNALTSLRKYDEAMAAYDKALELNPSLAAAWVGRGTALNECQRDVDALAAFDQALAKRPDFAEAWVGRGNALILSRGLDEALACFDKAIELRPDLPATWNGRGLALCRLDRYQDSLEAIDHALTLDNQLVGAWINRGDALSLLRRFDDGLAAYQRALDLDPALEQALAGKGQIVLTLGNPKEAMRLFDRSLSVKPNDLAISNKIFALDFLEGTDFAQHQDARDAWWRIVGPNIARMPAQPAINRDPGRRIILGYVSADFRRHSAAYSFGPILRQHDQSEFEVVCYDNAAVGDDLTLEFQKGANRWRHVSQMSDDKLAQQIRDDGVDILIDLSGHSNGNRLTAFARKPAPVQVSAWGHATGTGLPAMDYLFADPVVVPTECHGFFAERIYDLPCVIPAEAVSAHATDSEPPMLECGHVTFGVFNRPEKLTDAAIRLWSKVLDSVPGSRLVVKGNGLEQETRRRAYAEKFTSSGIGSDRLTILGSTPRDEHLAAIQGVDICLDPFPQNGGVSTWEALRMGVPVVCMLGPWITNRLSASIVSSIGLRDWVAETEIEYLEIARKFAAAPDQLFALRRSLPDRIAASPAGDLAAYTRAVEAAYRAMWTEFCNKPIPPA